MLGLQPDLTVSFCDLYGDSRNHCWSCEGLAQDVRKIISFLMFWGMGTEGELHFFVPWELHILRKLRFGLDMVMKYGFVKGRIYRKLMFMLNNFKIDLLFMYFFLVAEFFFFLCCKRNRFWLWNPNPHWGQ